MLLRLVRLELVGLELVGLELVWLELVGLELVGLELELGLVVVLRRELGLEQPRELVLALWEVQVLLLVLRARKPLLG